jgi:hypothetical protein
LRKRLLDHDAFVDSVLGEQGSDHFDRLGGTRHRKLEPVASDDVSGHGGAATSLTPASLPQSRRVI